jgi:hypothetical protein
MLQLPDKKFKDLAMNDKITVQIPVHVALGFLTEYQSTPWAANDANNVVVAILREILDVQFMKSFEANLQAQIDQQEAIQNQAIASFLGGNVPGFLPPGFEQ